MYALTKDGTFESGVYAIVGVDNMTTVQFFVHKDDAVSYNTQLEALDQELVVTEVESDKIDKICEMMGFAHVVIEPGHMVIPRVEILPHQLGL